MSGSLRIFLSSTCNNLFQERRDIAISLIDSGHTIIVSELPEKIPVSPNLSCVENCLEAITNHCDILVLIISDEYGSVDDQGRSITLKEYSKAKQLKIPVITFVKQEVFDLLPIYKKSPTTNLSPNVKDNRIFDFILKVTNESKGDWVFCFDDAQSIIKTLKFQLSCFFRNILPSKSTASNQLHYLYISNSTQLINLNGNCIRTFDYIVKNDTDEPISRLKGGDVSDIPMSFDDTNLSIINQDGTPIKWDPLQESASYRRWNIILDQDLLPGEIFKYSTSFNSFDNGQMQTWVEYPVQIGLIRYSLPSELIREPITTAIHGISGWKENPKEVEIRELGNVHIITCPFKNKVGMYQFKLKWA